MSRWIRLSEPHNSTNLLHIALSEKLRYHKCEGRTYIVEYILKLCSCSEKEIISCYAGPGHYSESLRSSPKPMYRKSRDYENILN